MLIRNSRKYFRKCLKYIINKKLNKLPIVFKEVYIALVNKVLIEFFKLESPGYDLEQESNTEQILYYFSGKRTKELYTEEMK